MKITLMIFGVFITKSIIAQLPTSNYSFVNDSTITKVNYQYKPFNFSLPASTNFSNYPLTSAQIKQQEKQKKLYNRTINTITNSNRNGLVGNIISLSGWELERYKPKPKLSRQVKRV